MSNEWREAQNSCLREIERHQEADKSYMDEGVQLLELARKAQELFAQQQPQEKRRLLNFLLSNCTWEDGEVIATFRQPFDLLAETAVSAGRAAADGTGGSTKTEIWLCRQSCANSSLRPNSLFTGKKQGISTKTGVLGRKASRKNTTAQRVSG